MRNILTLFLLVLLLAGCKSKNQTTADQETILNYISANHLNAIAEPNGLYFVPTVAGNGSYPTLNSTVTVNYTGYFTNDSIFAQSPADSPATVLLNQAIPGWQEGIPLIRQGGSGILLIPSALGYGGQAIGPIPAHSVLIYNIQLVSFH